MGPAGAEALIRWQHPSMGCSNPQPSGAAVEPVCGRGEDWVLRPHADKQLVDASSRAAIFGSAVNAWRGSPA